MALSITRRDIEEAHSYARDALRNVRGMSQAGENVVGSVVQTLEVAAGATAVGVLTGRFGPLHFAGNPIPLDLCTGVGMHLLAFMGIAGQHSPHLHNFADGILAGYLTKFGVGFGTEMRAKAGKPALNLTDISGDEVGRAPAQMYAGRGPVTPLSESELAAMAQAVR